MTYYGQFVDATIAAGGTESAAVDLGREYDFLSLIIPALDSCKLSLKVSNQLTGTYYPLGDDKSTEEETFNRAAIWMLGGWRFIKIVSTQKQSHSVTIKAQGGRN